MKTVLAALAGVSMLAVCGAASADNYASIGYSKIDLDVGGASADLGAVTGRLGVNVNSWFGVEGEFSLGVSDESATVPAGFGVPAGNYSIELKHQVGAFVVARAPLGEGFTVFGRVGYSSAKAEATAPGAAASDSGDGVAYGVGAQYDFGLNNAVRADYTKYDIEEVEADALSISFVRKF